PLVVLPADYTFAAADAGTKTFSVTLQTPPSQTLTVADTANASLTATAQIALCLLLLPLNVKTPKVVQTPLPPQAGPRHEEDRRNRVVGAAHLRYDARAAACASVRRTQSDRRR